MKTYVQLSPAEKLKLLNDHCLGERWKSLDETRWCLHCESQFTGHSARVYRDDGPGLWLECGTPDCDGSPIDWAEFPWWDENHPRTKAQAKMDAADETPESETPENN